MQAGRSSDVHRLNVAAVGSWFHSCFLRLKYSNLTLRLHQGGWVEPWSARIPQVILYVFLTFCY